MLNLNDPQQKIVRLNRVGVSRQHSETKGVKASQGDKTKSNYKTCA